jgi:hypothetical protein
MLVRSRVALMAMPPSCVALKRENIPGFLLSIRMSARGVRRPPSRMTMELLLPLAMIASVTRA